MVTKTKPSPERTAGARDERKAILRKVRVLKVEYAYQASAWRVLRTIEDFITARASRTKHPGGVGRK